MKQRERDLWAFYDGELSERKRRRLESRLDADPDQSCRLRQMEGLGAAIRTSWTDGPHPPSPEYLIQALRPQLVGIDQARVHDTLSPLARFRGWLSEHARPVPVSALAGSFVAAMLLLVLGTPLRDQPGTEPLAEATANLMVPTAVYDLDPESAPVLLYQLTDGSTVIWLLEDEKEQLSGRLATGDSWV